MRFFQLFVLLFLMVQCARPGAPTGGPQDKEPPKVLLTSPPDKSTFFTGREIQITFDEYLQLKDLNNQLLVSPPLQGKVKHTLKKKTLVLTFEEDLRDSTTYTFSLGKGITDLNEGNIAEGLRYVVSTGSFLDSLTFQGVMLDAFTGQPEAGALALLYEPSDTIESDSLLYKAFPSYYAIANEQGQFKFENLKYGQFFLFGLLDKNANYQYNGPPEKVAFWKTIIETDTLMQDFKMLSFKEQPLAKLLNGQYKNFGQVDFNFNSAPKNLVVQEFYPEQDSVFDVSEKLISTQTPDTLSYFFVPRDESNRQFLVFVDTAIVPDTVNVFLRASKQPKLSVKAKNGAEIHPGDTFQLTLNLPLQKLDLSLITLTLSDSIAHPFALVENPQQPLQLGFVMERDWEQTFQLQLAPGALVDIFGVANDTLKFDFKTKAETDYGSWTIQLQADRLPVILSVLSEKDIELKTFKTFGNQTIKLPFMLPGKYKLRTILDNNNNGHWDAGNLYEKIDSEVVYYNKSAIEIRANWDVETGWDIRAETLLSKEPSPEAAEAGPATTEPNK